jgi:hypothetical protein
MRSRWRCTCAGARHGHGLAHGCGSVGSDDYTWYRGTWKQVLQHRDGVTVDASGLSPLLRSLGKLIPATRSSNDSYWLSGTRDRQLPTAKRRPGGTRERTRCVGPTVGGFDEAAVHEAGCRWGGHRRLAIAASAARLVPTVTLTPTSDRSLLATVDLTPGTL